MFAADLFPNSTALAVQSSNMTLPAYLFNSSSISVAYSSTPCWTRVGAISYLFTIATDVSFFSSFLNLLPSRASKPISISTSPGLTLGENTFSPILILPHTLPPLCDRPTTSLVFTSSPARWAA